MRYRSARSGETKRNDVLPDDVLLEIFDFYNGPRYRGERATADAWQTLVHVCRRWRNVVFGSPRRLNLQLFCTPETPARDKLDVWPALPIIVAGNMAEGLSGTDNIIAALGQSNRVCDIYLWGLATWELEEVLAQMQVSFPELTGLRLAVEGETGPVIPNSFLDGSAPCLRTLELTAIPFPGLPKFLLSATQLVCLWLFDIPHSGYISPETMVALLSALSNLVSLHLGFESPQSRPDSVTRQPPPPERSILPTLETFRFKGVTEYLEDLVTVIDTPRLNDMDITFFNQIDFDCPRLVQFIMCTPELRALDKIYMIFDDNSVSAELGVWGDEDEERLEIYISCKEPDWQLSSIEQVCNSLLHPLSTIEVLYIWNHYRKLVWKDDLIENALWLQLLLPFTAVKELHVSKKFMPSIAATLKELVGGRIAERLPNLQNILVEDVKQLRPFEESIGQFVAERQLSGHPITISVWED